MTEKVQYFGAEALARVKNLSIVKVDPDAWETEYKDVVTGETWILDYPESEQHGGGPPRLRKKE